MTEPTPAGRQLAADLANAEGPLRYGIILAGPMIGLAAALLGLWL